MMLWNGDDENRGNKDDLPKESKGPWGVHTTENRQSKDESSQNEGKMSSQDNSSNPWGRRHSESSSRQENNIDDLIDHIQQKIRKMISGEGTSGGNSKGGSPIKKNGIPFVLLTIGAILCWLGTGFYRVQEGEVGVVLRFGEMVRTSFPGLQYHLPTPFETVIVQKVAVLNTIDSALKADRGSDTSEADLILTGDENMVHTNYTVLWKIKDVAEYLFTARNPNDTIRVAAESVIRGVIGQTAARLALTEGRGQIEARAQQDLQKLLDQYKIGVQVVSIQLQNVAPPHQVVDAFNDLQASLVNADQSRNEAEAYRNQIIPRAEGNAAQILNEAEAYNKVEIAKARGQADLFNQVLKAYEAHPSITTKRYYLDTMQSILSKTNKIIVDKAIGKGGLPYLLPLNEHKGVVAGSHQKGDVK